MTTLAIEATPRADAVKCTDSTLEVHLSDGRTLSVPLEWFPRLASATPSQRDHYELMGDGSGIHWPDVDEDISVVGLLLGNASRELPSSWS
jgi:hypothetical protein